MPSQPVAPSAHPVCASALASPSTRTLVERSQPPVFAVHAPFADAVPVRSSVGPVAAVTAAVFAAPPDFSDSRPVLEPAQVPAAVWQLPSAPSRSASPSIPHLPVQDAFWTAFSPGVAALPRSLRAGPEVSPRQPSADSHTIVAPSLVARVLTPPSPLPSPKDAFDVTASWPVPLRLDELQPWSAPVSVQDACRRRVPGACGHTAPRRHPGQRDAPVPRAAAALAVVRGHRTALHERPAGAAARSRPVAGIGHGVRGRAVGRLAQLVGLVVDLVLALLVGGDVLLVRGLRDGAGGHLLLLGVQLRLPGRQLLVPLHDVVDELGVLLRDVLPRRGQLLLALGLLLRGGLVGRRRSSSRPRRPSCPRRAASRPCRRRCGRRAGPRWHAHRRAHRRRRRGRRTCRRGSRAGSSTGGHARRSPSSCPCVRRHPSNRSRRCGTSPRTPSSLPRRPPSCPWPLRCRPIHRQQPQQP